VCAAHLLGSIQRFIDDLSLDLQILILHADTPCRNCSLSVIVKDLPQGPTKKLSKLNLAKEHSKL
jgi:hypothetical protein